MSKSSSNPIPDLNADWGYDPITGLKYSGASVQAFIKQQLGRIAGAAHFDSYLNTMYWFASEEDKAAWLDDNSRNLVLYSTHMSFLSELFRIAITNNNGSNQLNVATNEENVILSVSYDVQSRSIDEQTWHSLETGVFVSAYLDIGATGVYQVIQENTFMPPAQTFTLDVKDHLMLGLNRVKLQFVSEDDSSVIATVTYTITLTEMFIEPLNNAWYIPIIEGGDVANYKLGGFRIVGAVSKTLHIDIYSGSSKLLSFEKLIGNTVYDRVPYYFLSSADPGGLDLSDLETGVYVVVAYLTSGNLTSKAVTYNIMYVASGDANTAKLLCINSVEALAYNYTTAKLFEYSIYNQGLAYGALDATVKLINGTSTASTTVEPLENIETSVAHSFSFPLEWITEDTLDLKVQVTMEFGNEQIATIVVDNSATFPPAYGFEFYLNAASRGNTDANKNKIVNAVNGTEYSATWNKITFVNGSDGWTEDETGRKSLLIPARASMTLPYSEYRILNGDNITVEMCYRVSNVADYGENVITICDDPTLEGFRGIRIRPTNVTVHSNSDSSSVNDLLRGTNVMDERVVHFVLTIFRDYNGNTGRNLVTGYINGCKNFEFEYSTGTIWSTNGDLVIGSDRSDVALYFIRVYRSVLAESAVQQNYINSLPTISQREDLSDLFKSVMNASGSNVSYKSVRDNDMNYFVVEMLNGATVPSRANGWTREDNLSARSNLEMHFGKHPDWDWKIENVETTGQGTTSMGYYLWNLRWRIDNKASGKKADISYVSSRRKVGGSYVYEWTDPTLTGSVNFDGQGNHPKVMRITAKINFASSMQSHKMGATLAYSSLYSHDLVGLHNEAQEYAEQHNLPSPAVSVYQYPVYGFEKRGNDYTFIGLFTIGPDKGDKPTFGYNIDSSISSELITLEGSDHDRVVVMFNHPWNEYMEFRSADEFLNVTAYSGSKRGGWEVGNCHGYDTGASSDQSSIQDVLEQEFKPAYDLVFENSTLIFGIAKSEYTGIASTAEDILEYINNHVSEFGGVVREGNRLSNSNYQFWIEDEYVLYYLDARTGKYVAGVDLVTEHGTPTGSTVAEKNEWFKAQRRARFMASAEEYWDIQDALYHYAFIIAIGAIDNFGKNTYPYKMKAFNFVDGHNTGGKWKWRQDDLDSILGVNNSGFDTVPVSAEYNDVSSPGAAIFGGSPSVFWTLIDECYMEDYVSTESQSPDKGIRSMGKSLLSAMSSTAGGANMLAGVLAYFKNTFWDNAQNYFPQSAYNADAVLKYESAWIAHDDQQADPLGQALGNHYEAEYYWVYNRVIYLLSLFRAGPFGVYNDDNLGQIAFRPVNLPSLKITPFSKMYPALGDGTTMRNGTRTDKGVEYSFDGPFSAQGQTTLYINAADNIEYLGDWKDFQVNLTLTPTVTIVGKKLLEFKIGDEEAFTDEVVTPAVYYTAEEIAAAEEGDDAYGKTTSDIKTPAVYASNVTTNITGLSFGNEKSTPKCLEVIDARYASSLIDTIDVSSCKRLKEAYFEGTSLSQITFARGQRIEKIHFPSSVASIFIRDLKLLTEAVLPEDSSILTLIRVDNSVVDGFSLMKSAYSSENSSLQYIHINIDGVKEIDNDTVKMLINIGNGKSKDGNDVSYGSVSEYGAPISTSGPTIGGIVMPSRLYSDDIEGLELSSSEPYQENYMKALSGLFGTPLYIIYDPADLWIKFEDEEAESICVEKWGSDGHITTAQAASATVGQQFKGKTAITAFKEFIYFTGVTALYYQGFSGCTNLTKIGIPPTVTSGDTQVFSNCTRITEIHIADLDKYLNIAWGQTPGTSHPFGPGSGGRLFLNGTEITEITYPNTTTEIKRASLYKHTGLTSVVIPSSVTSIGDSAFVGCSGLINLTIPTNCSIGNIENSGAGTGTLTINGNLTGGKAAGYKLNYDKIVITGDELMTGGNAIRQLQSCVHKIHIVKGSVEMQPPSGTYHIFYSGTTPKFIEIMGDFVSGGTNMIGSTGNCDILHLGYSQVITAAPGKIPISKVDMVYVGDGSSAEHDDAILALYTAAWPDYTAKLGTWYDYIHSDNANPDYIN